MKISIIIPTYNAGSGFSELLDKLNNQSITDFELIVIDSSSSDGTVNIAKQFTEHVMVISQSDFDHGGTRNLVFEMSNADIYIFLTQDAIPKDNHAIENILKAFEDSTVGAAFGRQLPAANATAVAEHARLYNYPDTARVVAKDDIEKLGIKAAFCSNSFAAYRKEAIEEVGYFPSKLIFGEDGYAAGKMILAGWKIAYVASATVEHSHNYSLKQELSRYFDLGVFHKEESWLLDSFGKPEGEGMRFVRSEYDFLKERGEHFPAFKVILRNTFRYVGYTLGKKHAILSRGIKLYLTMNRSYWK